VSAPRSEADLVRERYDRRHGDRQRYSLLNESVLLAVQERQRRIVRRIRRCGWSDLSQLTLIEVGCGTGANLVEFVRLGFAPEHLQGIELLSESVARARRVLPQSIRIALADATTAGHLIAPASQDVVFQATVFSSLLNEEYQRQLADVMWTWVRPGGGILWYDFVYDNPRNPDVRGVSVARIRELFPEAKASVERLTLAPPLARIATRIHPSLYTLMNTLPLLRTHALAWLAKPAAG
jgi:SAM-dependent methyltransferase